MISIDLNSKDNESKCQNTFLTIGCSGIFYGFHDDNHLIAKRFLNDNIDLIIVEIITQKIVSSIKINQHDHLINRNRNIVLLWNEKSNELKLFLINKLEFIGERKIEFDFTPYNPKPFDLIKCYFLKDDDYNKFIITAYNEKHSFIQINECKLLSEIEIIHSRKIQSNYFKSRWSLLNILPPIYWISRPHKYLMHLRFISNLKISHFAELCNYEIICINIENSQIVIKPFKFMLLNATSKNPYVLELNNQNAFIIWGDLSDRFSYFKVNNKKNEIIEAVFNLRDPISYKGIKVVYNKLLLVQCSGNIFIYDVFKMHIMYKIKTVSSALTACITPNLKYIFLIENIFPKIFRVVCLSNQKDIFKFPLGRNESDLLKHNLKFISPLYHLTNAYGNSIWYESLQCNNNHICAIANNYQILTFAFCNF